MEDNKSQVNEFVTTPHIWCAIPVFNNKNTVKDVAVGCRALLKNVVVIDDGSTDTDVSRLFDKTDIIVLKHERNQGKGKAILTALRYIESMGGRFMITIDADGQHYPRDIEKFIPILQSSESSIVIGCRKFSGENIPRKSRFGREFANFWLHIETGIYVDDCQSGYRAYPVLYLSRLKLRGSHYDFETEVLSRAAWAGLELKMVEVDVWYPEREKRVSSFKPFIDNLRISLMHTRLVFERLLFFPHRRLVPKTEKTGIDYRILRHPIKLLRQLMNENSTPVGLAVSAGVGVFLGTLPLIATHTLAIIYVTTRLHLNKIMAVAIQNLCIPPLIPLVCIELGHYLRYKTWLTEISMDMIIYKVSDRLFEWFLGSLVVAPIMAIVIGVTVFMITKAIEKKESIIYARK